MTTDQHEPVTTDADPATSIGYADAMSELDAILNELDNDDIDIDVLSERVERAAQLIAICRGRIGSAQERVAGIVAGLDQPPLSSPDSMASPTNE